MARRRKKDEADQDVAAPTPSQPDVPDVRANGPWDAAERSVADDTSYVDLGSLLVRAREGLSLQLPADGESNEIGSVVMVGEDAALELRAFAASRSGGLWDEVRADILTEVERLGGQSQEISGLFGPELHVRVPVELPEGEEGFQPSRILGIEGPRWLLRATLLGEAGLNPSDEGVLMDALRDVVVVRGDDPRIPREPLLLTVPAHAVPLPDQE